MNLFAVFREGVYRHECGGIFSTVDSAVEAAVALITGECDHYHSYVIVPFDLDVKVDQEPVDGVYNVGGKPIEPAVIVTISRRKTDVIIKRAV